MMTLRSRVVAGGHRARAEAVVEATGTEVDIVVDDHHLAEVWVPGEELDQAGTDHLVTDYLLGRPVRGLWSWPTPTTPAGGVA